MEILFGLLCVLIGTAIILALVAVVGHGIWVMVAAMFGRSSPQPDHHERRSRRRGDRVCLGCGEFVSRDDATCPSCGLDPDSKTADELKDLEAAERTIDTLFEAGTLAAAAKRDTIRSIEARRATLLPRRRPLPVAEEEKPTAQLETWFGADQGQGLTVGEKQQALATLRTIPSEDLGDLSPRALLGIARLQASVGMLSRACQAYRVLFHFHPKDRVTGIAAAEAIQAAMKIEDWSNADDYARVATSFPGLLAQEPELAALVGQVRRREAGWAAEPAATLPKIEAAPVLLKLAESASAPIIAAPIEVTPDIVATLDPEIFPDEPSKPRRGFAEWIAVFMEERNILWGELIGGTLIVGCSIALVLSLWAQLEKIEFFPFVILAAITSALFGAGFYTLHHWKLESTSRGLLLIATLLVPLDFLVLAGLTRTSVAGPLDYVLGAAALSIFGWLLYRSSRILVGAPLDMTVPASLAVTGSILVSAGMQLVALGGLTRENWQPFFLYPLSLVPVLGFVAAVGVILWGLRNVQTWNAGRLAALLIGLGASLFACGVTMAFPLLNADRDLATTLLHLSPALTLLGVPILMAGTLIHQKLMPGNDGDRETHGLWGTLGTALALGGVFVMFGGFAVSLEEPVHRWVSGVINIGTLLGVAWGLRVPALHVFAQLYLAMLVVVGWPLEIEDFTRHPDAALRLTGLLLAQTIVAEALYCLNRVRDARCYAIGGGVSTVLAGMLIASVALSFPGTTALVLATAALAWLAANLRWRLAELTYACSLVLAVAIFFAFRYANPSIRVAEQALWTLLSHATLCLVASVGLRFTTIDWLRDFFRTPLQIASLAASFFAGAVILGDQFPAMLAWAPSCIACCWLAALWLTIALLEGSPMLFGAFQIMLALAWIFGAGDWLTWHDWDWREPYSLHVYALGIGIGSLAWEAARIGSRSRPRWQALLSPSGFVPMDRILSAGLVVGFYVLSLSVALFSVGRELSRDPQAWRLLPHEFRLDQAYSIWAWLTVVVLAGVLCVWLRELAWEAPLVGFMILALTIPLLIAGAWFDSQRASASALRWGLAFCYGTGSLMLWYRHRLGDERSGRVPVFAIRAILAVGAVAPIIVLTTIVAVIKLGGGTLPGPDEASIFHAMTGPVSLLVPLAMLSAVLAGHGFRDRLAHYLLAAGLLLTVSSVGGFFLAVPRGETAEPWVAVDALLLASAVAWGWSIAWTWIAGLLETDDDRPMLDSPLLTLHALLGAAPFAVVMFRAFVWIALGNDEPGRLWTLAAGSYWSWLAYALMSVGASCLFWKRGASLPLHLLGILGATAVGALTCSFEVIWPGQSFVALMFMSGVFACCWVYVTLLLDPRHPPRWLTFSEGLWESPLYACLAGALAVFMSISTLDNKERPIWSAQSVVLTAVALGLLAYQRRTETWMSFASLLMMLAGTILVVHFDPLNADLWLEVIQVNVAVLGAMSLLRLALHRFLMPMDMRIAALHQLPVQIALGTLANLLLLHFPLMWLAQTPNETGDWLWAHAGWSGWLALLTNAYAVVWYLTRVQPRLVGPAVTLSGLLLGIVLAGTADVWLEGAWTAFHTLTSTWTLLGLILLTVSWWGHTQYPGRRWIDELRDCFPAGITQVSVSVCGALVVTLALREAWVEPAAPYWSAGNTLAVSVLLGAIAIWSGAALYLFASGLLLNVIGLIVYSAWAVHHPHRTDDEIVSYFLLAQALSFGSAAILWSVLECVLHRRRIDISHGIAPFTQAAIFGGIVLLALDTIFTNVRHLDGNVVHLVPLLAWLALGIVLAATLIEGWRPRSHRFTRSQLYTAGLCAIAIFLQSMSLSITDWQWAATVLLAGYVLLIVTVQRLYAWMRPADEVDGLWLWHVQLVSMGLIVVYSVWITLNYPTWQERLGGPLAVSLVTLAAFLCVPIWPSPLARPTNPRYLVLTLGLALALETCWACLDQGRTAVWLQGGAATTTVVIAVMLLYRFVIPRMLVESAWREPTRVLGAVLGAVSVLLVFGLLGQELVMYNAAEGVRRTPMRVELVIVVAAAMLCLPILSICSALSKTADVYGLENQRRSLYVYLAELLTVALFAHLRLNVPDMFSKAMGERWYFVVMVIAFVGLILSEICKRRDMPVLAIPLKRSAVALAFLPVIAFQLAPLAAYCHPLGEALPGISPFLRYLEKLSNANVFGVTNLPAQSVCWLLLGIFLGSLARLHNSANYGIFAALAVNFGVWVLLAHQDATTFLERPQLWLIPLGLIVLVAEFINRHRLGFWPSLWVRYAGLLCIYLSSTIEMFSHGLRDAVMLPIVLAGLAVAGMLLGILFRVRAFVLSGFLALLVVIFTQIWNAAVFHSQTWIWWVCGIVLGLIILVMFALFEKHRNEVAKLLDNVKRWD